MSLPATDQIWPVEERRKDRWTIKRDFALEINEMRPRSFITQKFFEDLLLLLPCLLLLSPQLLSTCSLRMKINNGRKGFTQDHRARERAFAYLPCPPIVPISPFLQLHPVSVLLPTTDGRRLGRMAYGNGIWNERLETELEMSASQWLIL